MAGAQTPPLPRFPGCFQVKTGSKNLSTPALHGINCKPPPLGTIPEKAPGDDFLCLSDNLGFLSNISVHLFILLSIYLHNYLYIYIIIYISTYLSIYRYLSNYLSIFLLSIYFRHMHTPLNDLNS